MQTVRFIHLSDPHYLRSYQDQPISRLINKTGIELTQHFRAGMQQIYDTHKAFDFILISGDLVHEGTAEEYTSFRQFLAELTGDTPVYMALGNHDRDTFWQGFLDMDEHTCGPYFYEKIHTPSGLRIIALDSRGGQYGMGRISSTQLEWLKGVLSVPNKTGSILMLHHTPFLGDGEETQEHPLTYQLENARELYDVVKNSDILGIFTGHTHCRYNTCFGSIPCFTADGITFGVHTGRHSMTWDNHTGYNYCVLEQGQIEVEPYVLPRQQVHMVEFFYNEFINKDKA